MNNIEPGKCKGDIILTKWLKPFLYLIMYCIICNWCCRLQFFQFTSNSSETSPRPLYCSKLDIDLGTVPMQSSLLDIFNSINFGMVLLSLALPSFTNRRCQELFTSLFLFWTKEVINKFGHVNVFYFNGLSAFK